MILIALSTFLLGCSKTSTIVSKTPVNAQAVVYSAEKSEPFFPVPPLALSLVHQAENVPMKPELGKRDWMLEPWVFVSSNSPPPARSLGTVSDEMGLPRYRPSNLYLIDTR